MNIEIVREAFVSSTNARVDQLVRESFVFTSANANVDQLVREAWILIPPSPTFTQGFLFGF